MVFDDLHRYYRFSKGMVWFNTGDNDDNGPKRRETRHLGLGEFFFISFVVFIILITIVHRFSNDRTQMTVTHPPTPPTPAAAATAATAGTPSHQHKRRLAGGDEGSRLARLDPLTVCVFFFSFFF